MGRADAAFDPEAILAELKRHGVQFVVIGAFAAVTQGWPEPTGDIDITPDRDVRNLRRLAAALHALDAQVLTEEGEIDASWPIDDQHLRLRETTLRPATATSTWSSTRRVPTATEIWRGRANRLCSGSAR